jgi:hypothetical protein
LPKCSEQAPSPGASSRQLLPAIAGEFAPLRRSKLYLGINAGLFAIR